jgi:hypothetical protein
MAEQAPTADNAIELRIEEISQLFHTLDPFPFREKDLDADAEEFIVSWARELPSNQPLRIVLHLPDTQASRPEARELNAALTRYFNYRARVSSRELKEFSALALNSHHNRKTAANVFAAAAMAAARSCRR